MINFVNNSEPDLTAENLNKMQQDIGIVVSATEPQGNNRLKVWLQNVDGKEKIYVLNNNNVYEEFIKGKVIKRGSVTNPDETKFEITKSNVIQVDNTVYVDITVKLLKKIPINSQHNFAITGVTNPKITTYPIGSYGTNEFNIINPIYVYVYQSTCYLANTISTSEVNGFWKAHFSYNVD